MTGIVVFQGFGLVVREALEAIAPILALFFIFQRFILKLTRRQVLRILGGMGLAFVGLALFLQGVNIGFYPVGIALGESLGRLDHVWLLIPIGFVLGFTATVAEPGVRVLNEEVDKVSEGQVGKTVMMITLSIGVGLSIALAMIRVVYGIPLLYILIPGYLAALLLMALSSRDFISVAFDSGGVATGPMTVAFVLSVTVGVSGVIEGRDPLVDAFGMITLVFLAPVLSVLCLGLRYREKDADGNGTAGPKQAARGRQRQSGC